MIRRAIGLRETATVLTLLIPSLLACAAHHRSTLLVVADEVRTMVPVESTQYMPFTDLNDPSADARTQAGPGRVVMLTVAARGRTLPSESVPVFSFDENLRYRVYLQLPPGRSPAATALDGHSFVELTGRYDIAASERLFLPHEGQLSLDSSSESHVFLTLAGKYRNGSGRELTLEGQVRVKISD